jgi:hypothetical protein
VTETRPKARRSDPNVATLITWILPGAGHLYLGLLRPALVGFVLIEGLYALGWWLSEGRAFEFLEPELQGPFATVLSPEVGNLGGMIAQLRNVGFGSGEPSPFPAHVALGSLLCALSGLGNAFCMVHAHLAARSRGIVPRSRPSPFAAVALTWAVPGLGHWLQGRRLRAAIVFTLLVGFFLWGTWLSEGSNLSRERHFYYWSGQLLVGLPAIGAELVFGRPPVTHEIPLVDYGLLFACMSGLLNVLAMMDAYGTAERRWFHGGSQA